MRELLSSQKNFPQYLMNLDKKLSGMRMSDDDNESIYFAHDKRNIKQVAIWHDTFGMKTFMDEEFEKLMEYAKFLISLREK